MVKKERYTESAKALSDVTKGHWMQTKWREKSMIGRHVDDLTWISCNKTVQLEPGGPRPVTPLIAWTKTRFIPFTCSHKHDKGIYEAT